MHKNIKIIKNADMSAYTTFKTGGKADMLLLPANEEELVWAVNKYPEAVIIGAGSNLLVSDDGIRGAVIRIADPFCNVEKTGENIIEAQSGARLSAVCNFALSNGLFGMEFAGGIPGTVGGGVIMNAGAYGGELKDVLTSCRVLDRKGRVKQLAVEEMELSYRHSAIMDSGDIVLSAEFSLNKGSEEEIAAARNYLKELNGRRRDKQPLEYPSAGSTFKRPEGNFAGALIEKTGLKGKSVGGAQVSEKHAGFVINTGNATSTDIYNLIHYVQKAVFDRTGIMLEPEVRFVGEFNV